MVAIIKGNVTHCYDDSVLCYSMGGQWYRYSRNVVSGSAMIFWVFCQQSWIW